MKSTMFVLFVSAITFLFCLNAIAGDFTDNGNGTVTDNVTGLIWKQEDNETCFYTWEQALTYCEDSLILAGYSDWRLPNVKELESIVDIGHYAQSIDLNYFPNTYLDEYWSSTTGADVTSYAWVVDFGGGSISWGNKGSDYHCVRCVRAGQ